MDVRDSNEIVAVVQSITTPLDLLVNNAAVYDLNGLVLHQGTSTLYRICSISIHWALQGTQAAMPLLAKAGGSVVVMVSTGMASISDRPGNALSIGPRRQLQHAKLSHAARSGASRYITLSMPWLGCHRYGWLMRSSSPQQSVKGILERIREQTLRNGSLRCLQWHAPSMVIAGLMHFETYDNRHDACSTMFSY